VSINRRAPSNPGLYHDGISQPGQCSRDLIAQAFGVGARLLMVAPSGENGLWPNSGESSAFIGVDTVVPEPQSWATMITGFGVVGATLRRRRPAAC
jgi:hypothetical protein